MRPYARAAGRWQGASLVDVSLCYSLRSDPLSGALSVLIGSISPLVVGFAEMGASGAVVETVSVWSRFVCFSHSKTASRIGLCWRRYPDVLESNRWLVGRYPPDPS